jgi:SAM-dependent MidA family methyltransferase
LEAGAGDGTFAMGVLSTLRHEFSEVFAATRYVVDEISPDSRLRLTSRLDTFHDNFRFASLASLSPIPAGVVFTNELLDALPVHLVTLAKGRFCEMHVMLDDKGRFAFVPLRPSTPALLQFCEAYGTQPAEGQIIEINLAVEEWLTRVAQVLNGGYLITVDYGAEAAELHSRPKGTLRGYVGHDFVDDLLNAPGECDITSTVNWTQITTTGSRLGLQVVQFLEQDRFLLQEGALVELQNRLDRTSSEAEKLQLTTAARDLILPGGMSSSYQVLVQRQTE